MKSVKQGPVAALRAWFSHSCLWFGAVCLSGPRWRTEPKGDGSGHRGSSLWVMIYQPGVFKALLILLSITGPPVRPLAPPRTKAPQSIWRGCCSEMCFTGKWQDAYAANKSSPSPDGFSRSLALSFPCEGAEEICQSGDCPRGMGTLNVEMFPTITCILGSSAWHRLQVNLRCSEINIGYCRTTCIHLQFAVSSIYSFSTGTWILSMHRMMSWWPDTYCVL